jgi:predicted transcriptional regulator
MLQIALKYVTSVDLMCLLHYAIIGGIIVAEKRTMTLNLSEEEMSSLEQLARRNDMSKTAVLRKAIRIYLILEKRLQRGEHIFVEDEAHQGKVELLLV